MTDQLTPREVQPEIPDEEPIEQVFSQEPEDVRPIEPSTESEDQQRFEETARFEEEIDTPKVEPKSEQKQVRKTKVKASYTVRGEVYSSVYAFPSSSVQICIVLNSSAPPLGISVNTTLNAGLNAGVVAVSFESIS